MPTFATHENVCDGFGSVLSIQRFVMLHAFGFSIAPFLLVEAFVSGPVPGIPRQESLVRIRGIDRTWPLFVQGEAPRNQLIARFIESGRGILLGTTSFWEGVDVPGRPLRGLKLRRIRRDHGSRLDGGAQAAEHPLFAAAVRADEHRPRGFAQQRQVAGTVAVDGGERRMDARARQRDQLAGEALTPPVRRDVELQDFPVGGGAGGRHADAADLR